MDVDDVVNNTTYSDVRFNFAIVFHRSSCEVLRDPGIDWDVAGVDDIVSEQRRPKSKF